MRHQVSHPYKTTGRIIVLYILTFTFLDSRRDDKRLITSNNNGNCSSKLCHITSSSEKYNLLTLKTPKHARTDMERHIIN
jgi:hypothetical protein